MKHRILCLLIAGLLASLSSCHKSPNSPIIAPVVPVVPVAPRLYTPPEAIPVSLIDPPPSPDLTPAGRQLILDWEVGGGEKYYNRFLIRPEWPGLHSGVTVAVGVDLGYNSKSVILSDWRELPDNQPERLAALSGITGKKAEARVNEVHDILIAWKVAEGVFDRITVAKFYAQAQRAFPGFDELRPSARAVLTSLIFNRGGSMIGANRLEMRNIRSLVPKKDYGGIALELRKMKRIWKNTSVARGLESRREAEARLMEAP